MLSALAFSAPHGMPLFSAGSPQLSNTKSGRRRSCPWTKRPLHAALCSPAVLAASRRRCRKRISRGAISRQQQVLPFKEPCTGCEVVLVACMHFNPQSISKASDVTRELAAQGNLGAVVLESCPSRWRKAQEVYTPGSLMQSLFDNEMQAACKVAESSGRRVILGDQHVEDLLEQVILTGTDALDDIFSPQNGGWDRTDDALSSGLNRLLEERVADAEESQEDSIGIQDFLDPLLLLGMPLALLRYVGSTAMKAPQLFLCIGTSMALFTALPDNIFSGMLRAVAEVLILRIVLSAVLRDRDAILARSVKDACEAMPRSGGSVVAILGAAHCNGVKRYLTRGGSFRR